MPALRITQVMDEIESLPDESFGAIVSFGRCKTTHVRNRLSSLLNRKGRLIEFDISRLRGSVAEPPDFILFERGQGMLLDCVRSFVMNDDQGEVLLSIATYEKA
jgi:hypothetical protein